MTLSTAAPRRRPGGGAALLPRSRRVLSVRADDGTRTHDLLHGKRVVGSAHLKLNRAWLCDFRHLAPSERRL